MARCKNKELTERQKNFEPTSFHFNKDLKELVQDYVFNMKKEGKKYSQEQFINDAVSDRCKRLKLS